jgi:pyruvate ferredoxin oxidoreductase alpha subunit
MRKFIEGSQAIAEVVKLCKPGVISAYPITPQTHIVEGLARFVANGELKSEFVNVESEHSAASTVLGAVAAGVRAFTATSSQGLLLMAEVIFNIAGMRLPLVLACANRSVSAPINIWNDQQDVMTVRDSGWILMFAETIQEAIDFHLLGYRVGEDHSIMLPVMVNLDGYILTHGLEVVDIPSQESVDKFLPAYRPLYKLDPSVPITLGCLATPEHYMETRAAIQETHKEVLNLIPKVVTEFKNIFDRETGGLIEGYRLEDAKQVIVAMGSVIGTIKETIDDLRNEGKKVGALKIITYRPFPKEAILNALKDIQEIAVVEKAISLGSNGPLYTDLTSIFLGRAEIPKISGFILGLGGRDITKDSIRQVFNKLSRQQVDCEFIDMKKELLEERYVGT